MNLRLRIALPGALAGVILLVSLAPAGVAAAPARCASKGSRTLRSTELVRVFRRPGDGGRVYVACHKPSERKRVLARESGGAAFRSVRVSVRGTLVTLRYRVGADTCTRQLDVATGKGAMQCLT